ncbi:hypothetical protein [Cytobacillus praedii]|uniref:Uncharacterized protein n=1 Tax=Cytobacillus praedii TaxID=1742358 RepID=A0A4R1AX36_9BACI|nr:hypothetical protein [Cytobacillus praedii]TCJ05060.1 hypothetical protein E0Y62_07545 [Cytobacillus praedii]
MGTIFKNEKQIIEEQMWSIVLRETCVEDDAGCDWFTIGNNTFIGSVEWHVSSNEEVSDLVNAINALNGHFDLINAHDKETR